MGITRVTQPNVGYPNGECVRASYASLLSIPLEHVPRFDPMALRRKISFITIGRPDSQARQTEAERDWLRTLGLDLVTVPVPPGGPLPHVPPERYHLIAAVADTLQGPQPHRMVGQGGRLAWDPHPGGSKIIDVTSYIFVVPERS